MLADHIITDHDLFLCAITWGEFYDAHKQMARDGVGDNVWFSHVKTNLEPCYCRMFPKERHAMTRDDAQKVALRLRNHYAREVMEEYETAKRVNLSLIIRRMTPK